MLLRSEVAFAAEFPSPTSLDRPPLPTYSILDRIPDSQLSPTARNPNQRPSFAAFRAQCFAQLRQNLSSVILTDSGIADCVADEIADNSVQSDRHHD